MFYIGTSDPRIPRGWWPRGVVFLHSHYGSLTHTLYDIERHLPQPALKPGTESHQALNLILGYQMGKREQAPSTNPYDFGNIQIFQKVLCCLISVYYLLSSLYSHETRHCGLESRDSFIVLNQIWIYDNKPLQQYLRLSKT